MKELFGWPNDKRNQRTCKTLANVKSWFLALGRQNAKNWMCNSDRKSKAAIACTQNTNSYPNFHHTKNGSESIWYRFFVVDACNLRVLELWIEVFPKYRRWKCWCPFSFVNTPDICLCRFSHNSLHAKFNSTEIKVWNDGIVEWEMFGVLREIKWNYRIFSVRNLQLSLWHLAVRARCALNLKYIWKIKTKKKMFVVNNFRSDFDEQIRRKINH